MMIKSSVKKNALYLKVVCVWLAPPLHREYKYILKIRFNDSTRNVKSGRPSS